MRYILSDNGILCIEYGNFADELKNVNKSDET